MNRLVEQILCTMVTDFYTQWVTKLSFMEFTINSLVNESIQKTLFELLYEQQIRNIINQLDALRHNEGARQIVDNISKFAEEAKAKLLQAQENQAKYYGKHYHPVKFLVNDKVLLSTKNLQLFATQKFQQCFVRPLTVTERIGYQAYRLQLPTAPQQLHNIFYISLLKPYITAGYGVE